MNFKSEERVEVVVEIWYLFEQTEEKSFESRSLCLIPWSNFKNIALNE